MMVVVALIVAALAVLGAVVALATGRGGELAETHPDNPPLPIPTARPITGPEVAMLSLPRGLWGYHVGFTDEALHRVAYALAERDARVAMLEQQVAELRHRLGEAGEGDAWTAPDDLYGPSYEPLREDGDEPGENGRAGAADAPTVPQDVSGDAPAGGERGDGFEEELFEDDGPEPRPEPIALVKRPEEEGR
ncbi:hypothetical protein [Actinomadura kijaniata]|uniref:hypothetical protein n=1 Tax=Actinomadura kijaniata TaxID=46161 RepID=UPI0012FB5E50|nr:hypothetical protein [Actinomadura kijaniata]